MTARTATYTGQLIMDEALEQLPYFYDLLHIRETLEATVPRFPEQCCRIASRVVSSLLSLSEVEGEYEPGEQLIPPYDDHYVRKHAWNYDHKRRLFIDLTQDQFAELPGIVVLPDTTSILSMSFLPTMELREMPNSSCYRRVNLEELLARLRTELA